MKKIKQFEHNKQKTEKIHQQKLAQNRPTQSISLGQNHFKKNGTKATHHTNQDTTFA